MPKVKNAWRHRKTQDTGNASSNMSKRDCGCTIFAHDGTTAKFCKAHALEHKVNFGCNWAGDFDGNWHTDCDNMFILNEGGPEENKMKYCCYCGRKLKQKDYENEEAVE